jgi:RNA-directed DNA polymerase
MKPFAITKRMVWDAYKLVRKRKGSAGVDEQTLEEFDRDLKNNLYKLWNRLSSGSYLPPPVLRVEIPKKDGGTRPLGIPTVSDRIAQMVVKLYLEPKVDPHFHEDSYGYRPGKSALDAVEVARKRCWRNNFVLDVDIKGFFDSINHELLMQAVRKHTDCKWVLLYIERWLKAPVQLEDGTQEARDKGTPQGGVVSPLLANLYLHYAFDVWMQRNYPNISFERYADDIVIHCCSEAQAKMLREKLDSRMKSCCLTMHPEKTKIVYCKDADRCNEYPCTKFTFLGFEFRPRGAKNRWGKLFLNFLPAASPEALKKMRRTVRAWRLKWCSEKTPQDLSRMFNPFIRGWVNYYGKYYKSALFGLATQINLHLAAWAANKYKTCRRKMRKAKRLVGKIADTQPSLFAHWDILGYRVSSDGKRRAV